MPMKLHWYLSILIKIAVTSKNSFWWTSSEVYLVIQMISFFSLTAQSRLLKTKSKRKYLFVLNKYTHIKVIVTSLNCLKRKHINKPQSHLNNIFEFWFSFTCCCQSIEIKNGYIWESTCECLSVIKFFMWNRRNKIRREKSLVDP